MGPADTTPALLERAATRWPDAEAVVDGEVRLTFEQLAVAVRAARGAAIAAGLRHGDRAAIWAPNSWQWVVALLGLHSAGVTVVPLNTRFKGEEAADILDRSSARVLFTVRGFLGMDYPAMLEGHRTRLERTVLFGEPTWDEYLDGDAGAPAPVVEPDDLSDLIFTSGTTGRPKGVMSTHGQTVRVFRAWADIVGLRAGDRYLIATPFFHTFGYKSGIVASLLTGATVLPLAVADVPHVLRAVADERVTMLPATPTLFQSIFQHLDHLRNLDDGSADAVRRDLSTLRLSAVGAASVPVDLVERMRAELFDTVVTGYGLTESTGVVTMSRPGDPPSIISSTVGRALPGVEIRIVDGDGADLPAGSEGEVLVRGDNVMRGYLDDPEQTAATVDAEGWLHTGDVGRLDDEGYLAITDRLKDMYIVGGFNAYPAEIEAVLLRHPDVAMAAVVGAPDERLGEVGIAFVVPTSGASPSAEALVAWARERMANYKVPRRVELVDALPLNAIGKVVKDELRARLDTDEVDDSMEG